MANCKIGKKYPVMNNKILKTETDFEVIYTNQKEIDAANEWLKHKEDYLLCLSERHPHYKMTLQEIETIKKRIITLKTQ